MVPWWLNPWRMVRDYRKAALYDSNLIRRQEEIIDRQDSEIADLMTDNRKLRLGSGEGVLSTFEPDFVIVGIPRPGVGVRVIASQKLAGTRFDMTPMGEQPEWVIKAIMAQTLFVDKPTYPEAIAQISTIWANWARNQPNSAPGWRGDYRPGGSIKIPIKIDPAMPPGKAFIQSGGIRMPLELPWADQEADVRGEVETHMKEIEGPPGPQELGEF
jgi:hypothetical protein